MPQLEIPGDLRDRRIKILEEAFEFGPPVNQELIKAYNDVMDQIERLQDAHFEDPLMVLPREVWEDIIHWTIGTHSEDWEEWDVDQLIGLACISKAWEDAIISTASFWTNVSLDSQLQDMEVKVALCLQLSRDAPISVALNVETKVGDETMSRIVCESHRIRALFLHRALFSSSSADIPHPQDVIDTFLSRLGDPLALENLVVSVWYWCTPTIDDFLRRCSSLKYLSGVRISDSTIRINSVQGLRRLELVEPVQTIIPLLSQLKDIENVIFYSIPTYLIRENQEIPTNVDRNNETQLLPWKSISYFQSYYGTSFTNLLIGSSTTLLSLDVMIRSHTLTKLFSICSSLERLKSITIHLYCLPSTKFDPQLHICTTHVQHLSMTIGPDHEWNNRNSSENWTEDFIWKLFETMTILAANVRRLEIITQINPSAVLAYASSLRHLQKMTLELWGNMSAMEERVFPTVEEAIVRGNISFITQRSFPNAIGFGYDPRNLENAITFRPHLRYWINIRHLDIHVDSLDFEDIALPHLQNLVYSVKEDSECSQFHELLALKPHMFPSLTYLGHRSFPEWDILFIMLERRNFLCDRHIFPIKQVAFPCLPSKTILRPLKTRLLGRLSERPSNFELSVQSNLEIYLDVSISGCGQCHLGLLSCGDTSISIRSDQDAAVPLLPYPATTEEILRTRRERTSLLNGNKSKVYRPSRCDKHDDKNLVEISGLTDIGD